MTHVADIQSKGERAQVPEISVIMGVYSRNLDTTMLQRSVESVLVQTYRDFEFLICCDSDSCFEVYSLIENYCRLDSRVHLFRDEKAKTLSMKLNNCLRHVQGRYIARMDDDDWSHPLRFEKQLAFLNEQYEYSYVGSNVLIYRDGRIYGKRELPETPKKEDFLRVQPYIHPVLMFRRECFDMVGKYCEHKRCNRCEDFDLLLRFEETGLRGYNLKEELLTYTIPSASVGRDKFEFRLNYTVTRWKRFRALGMLPAAIPYIIKPLVVWLLPAWLLDRLKKDRIYTTLR